MKAQTIAAILLVTLAAACVEKSNRLSEAEEAQLASYVSMTAPEPQHALDVSFENKVRLVGYDVSAERATPGSELVVTWYWKSEAALDRSWRLFTHVSDASGRDRLNQDGDSLVRRIYPPGRWRVGQYIKDEQHITLPDDWSSPQVAFNVGVWSGPHRLRITTGPNDGQDRARALVMDVGPRSARPENPTPTPASDLPDIVAARAEGLTIDGRLDETAWANATRTRAFVNTMDGSPAELQAHARVLFDDTKLYVGFDVADDYLKAPGRSHDDHLWENDCVEVMIDPDGDGRNYFELQVSPRGTTFETAYDSRRLPRPFGHVDWNPEIVARVVTDGTVDDDDEDVGYTVELAIPYASLVNGDAVTPAPPPGSTWRVNFYVMDSREEGQRAAGWSAPRVGDFHTLHRFGQVRFGAPVAAPTSITTKIQPSEDMLRQLRALENPNRVREPLDLHRPHPGETVPTREDPIGRPTMEAPTMEPEGH